MIAIRHLGSAVGCNPRRTDRLGRIFPNNEPIVSLVGALLLEQNDEWAVQRPLYNAGKRRPVEQ